jgi:hypothetical protein
MGWRYPFQEQNWADVRQFEASAFQERTDGIHMLEVCESVLRSGTADQLAVATSMHDLMVVAKPVPEPEMDVLFVRTPSSFRPPKQGCVLIEYLAVSGRNTSIERPTADAVRLFWRFVWEKFGVGPIDHP